MYLITVIYRPLWDGWLSWLLCWPTDSGRLNHKVVTRPASSLAQDRESTPAETSVLTTMLHRQHGYYGTLIGSHGCQIEWYNFR